MRLKGKAFFILAVVTLSFLIASSHIHRTENVITAFNKNNLYRIEELELQKNSNIGTEPNILKQNF